MFYAVPEPVMKAVVAHLISDFAFVLYARLMGFWSAEKPVFASNKELGVWVGKSTRQIVQALAELGEAGLIKREMKGRVRYIYPVFTGVGERQEPRRGKPRSRSAENRAPGARKTAFEERGKPRSTNKEVTNKELPPPYSPHSTVDDGPAPAQPGGGSVCLETAKRGEVEPQEEMREPVSDRATRIRALLESQGSVVSERSAIEAAALPDVVTALWLEVERERRNGETVNLPLNLAKKRWESGRGVAPALLSNVSRYISGLDAQFGHRPEAVVTKPVEEPSDEPELPFYIAVLCGIPSAKWRKFHYDIARKAVREKKVQQGTLEELQAYTDGLFAEKQAREAAKEALAPEMA